MPPPAAGGRPKYHCLEDGGQKRRIPYAMLSIRAIFTIEIRIGEIRPASKIGTISEKTERSEGATL